MHSGQLITACLTHAVVCLLNEKLERTDHYGDRLRFVFFFNSNLFTSNISENIAQWGRVFAYTRKYGKLIVRQIIIDSDFRVISSQKYIILWLKGGKMQLDFRVEKYFSSFPHFKIRRYGS